MCGIAGIYTYDRDGFPVDRNELLRIREKMRNRGPDGAGLWISSDRRIGLAHRRLAIIDLSEAGKQPMQDADSGNQIVFNGEIFNHKELRSQLEDLGQRFESQSDTEVLIKLYAVHGVAMVHKLRGMYTFAIWDARRNGLLLARDPFGIKPLYIADDGKTLHFSSQVKSLLEVERVDTRPEPAGHAGFFLWGHVPEPYTLYRGIRAFPAGTSLWIDNAGKKEVSQFCNLTEEIRSAATQSRSVNQDEAQESLRHALLDSMRHHLVSDLPVGLFLSAGLDSATLLALASECLSGHSTLKTVTLGFREFVGTDKDEVPLAHALAQYYGSDHHTEWIQQADFTEQLEALLDSMDQPSIDGVNSYFICKAAKAQGLKVAISGLGGDELFAGYSNFQRIPRMVRCIRPFAALPRLASLSRNVLTSMLRRTQLSSKLAGLLEYGGTTAGAYLLHRSLNMPWELEGILESDFVREGLTTLQTMPALNTTIEGIPTFQGCISALETCWYMRNQLLRDADWAGMAHGVEVRVPLVDIKLFRLVQSLSMSSSPPSKQAMALTPSKPLPQYVMERQKTGFSVPVQEWMPGPCGPSQGLAHWAKYVRSHFL